MDWLASDDRLSEKYYQYFRFGRGRCTIIRKLAGEKKPTIWTLSSACDGDPMTANGGDHKTDKTIESWLENNHLLYDGEPSGGLCVILCSRVTTPSGYPCAQNYLPFSRDAYEAMADKFHFHPGTTRCMSRGREIFSKTIYTSDDGQCRKIDYDARMSKEWNDDLALSATFDPSTGLTVAIIYGCTDEQIVDFKRLFHEGQSAIHPLAVVGLFAELGGRRLAKHVDDLVDLFLKRTESIGSETPRWREVMVRHGEKPSDLLELYHRSRDQTRRLSAAKAQLLKMIDHVDEVRECLAVQHKQKGRGRRHDPYSEKDSGEGFASDCSEAGYPRRGQGQQREWQWMEQLGNRIRERLLEISEEYDRRTEDCRMVMDDLLVTTQIVHSHMARRETELNTTIAIATKRDSAQMKSIASLTMVYLPLTSVASIFSMGVFNWTAEGEESIITRFFWYYVIIAGGLTLVTILLWWLFVAWQRRRNDEKDGEGNILSV